MGRNVLGGINGADVIRYGGRCTGPPGSVDLTEMRRSMCRGRVCEIDPGNVRCLASHCSVFLSSDVAESFRSFRSSRMRAAGAKSTSRRWRRREQDRHARPSAPHKSPGRRHSVCDENLAARLSSRRLRSGRRQSADVPVCSIASTVEINIVLATCQRSAPAQVTSLPAVMLTRFGFSPASTKISPTARPTPVSSIINSAGVWFSSPHNGGRASRSATCCTCAGYDRPKGNRSRWRTSTRSAGFCFVGKPQWRSYRSLSPSRP